MEIEAAKIIAKAIVEAVSDIQITAIGLLLLYIGIKLLTNKSKERNLK